MPMGKFNDLIFGVFFSRLDLISKGVGYCLSELFNFALYFFFFSFVC